MRVLSTARVREIDDIERPRRIPHLAPERARRARPRPKPRMFGAVTVALYGALAFGIIPFHEPWRDEAQSWLIARDLPLAGIFKQMGYEGTPALWHLLQFPLAKLGAPFVSLLILNAVIATLAAATLLFFAPFRPWQRVAAAFSYAMLAEFGGVARYYALVALMLFLVARFYTGRRRRPVRYALVVAALANICPQATGVALLLLGERALAQVRSRKFVRHRIGALAVMAAGIALAVLQLRQPPDVFNAGWFPEFNPQEVVFMLRSTFLAGAGLSPILGSILPVVAFVIVMIDLAPRRDLFWIVLFTYIGWQYIFVFKYHAAYRHQALFTIVLVVAYWILREGSPGALVPLSRRVRRIRWPEWLGGLAAGEALLFAGLLLSMRPSIGELIADVRQPFSNAKEMAFYIRDHHIDAPIAVYKTPHASALLPWLPGRRWLSIEDGRPRTFLTWTGDFDWRNPYTAGEAAGRVTKYWPVDRPWLLLNEDLRYPEGFGYELVYHTAARPLRDRTETFWLYRPVPPDAFGSACGRHGVP